jgi:N-methylhydantoinase B
MARNDLDPITVEVVRHRVDGIANEMQETLVRSAFSTIVKEGRDASASIFTVGGDTLAQALAIPIHLTSLIPMVRVMLEKFGLETMQEGDLYISNDPYAAGGTHIPDIIIVMPVFAGGRPIAFTAAMTHHQDTGGMTAGSTPTNAVEIFQEGLRLPALKLASKGVVNEAILEILKLNVRLPEALIGDLNAQIAACRIGGRRLLELASSFQPPLLQAIFEDLLNRSEFLTRKAIERIPDGTYRYEDFLDNDGVDLDAPIRICVAVTISGDRIVFDLEGTSPQVRGPFNCMPSGTYAAACFVVRAIAGASVPTNGGCFRPIELRLPKGSLLNPDHPAPVGCRTATIKRVASAMLGALRNAVPDQIPANDAGVLVTIIFAGSNARLGGFVVTQNIVGGSGASAGEDGVDIIETDVTNTGSIPIEVIESSAPIRINYQRLARDSGGAGKRRGGLGCEEEVEALGEMLVTFRGERHFRAAAGTAGGADGQLGHAQIVRSSGGEETINSKRVTTLQRGDRLVMASPGGGGHGDPRARDQRAVHLDVMDGKVSAQAAAGTYGASETVIETSQAKFGTAA